MHTYIVWNRIARGYSNTGIIYFYKLNQLYLSKFSTQVGPILARTFCLNSLKECHVPQGTLWLKKYSWLNLNKRTCRHDFSVPCHLFYVDMTTEDTVTAPLKSNTSQWYEPKPVVQEAVPRDSQTVHIMFCPNELVQKRGPTAGLCGLQPPDWFNLAALGLICIKHLYYVEVWKFFKLISALQKSSLPWFWYFRVSLPT